MESLINSHSPSEVETLPLLSTEPSHALSNKGRRILSLYIQLYQVVDVGEVSEAVLMQIRGCGQRTAAEICHWLRSVSSSNTSHHSFCQLMTGPERFKRARLAERKVAAPAVYTSGYEGASIDGFLNRLVSSGLRHLVDVRRNPIARRYGFHRSTLRRLCEFLDIQYSHVPELGIESEKRQELNSQEDYEALFRDYCNTTLLSETSAVECVTKLAVESPCVLVCMEAQPRCCHRSHLATEVSKRSKLPVEHLI